MIITSLDTPAADVDVLSNDTANGQTIDVTTVVATIRPMAQPAVNATTGTITYIPDAGYIGPDSFTYTVDDTEGDTSNAALVTVTVTNPNAPIAVVDVISTPQDTPAADVDVLGNDTANGQTIVVTTVVATDPPNGTTAVNATTGTITYIPDAGYTGPDSFTYTVDDTEGDTSNAALVTVTVTNPNAPITVADVISTPQDTPATDVAVLGNDNANGQTIDWHYGRRQQSAQWHDRGECDHRHYHLCPRCRLHGSRQFYLYCPRHRRRYFEYRPRHGHGHRPHSPHRRGGWGYHVVGYPRGRCRRPGQ